MKKPLSAALFLVLVGLGLVATPTAPAAAADPYPGTVPTTTTLKHKAKVRAGKRFSVTVTVAASGNVPVTGQVGCTVKRKGGGYTKTYGSAYAGSPVKLTTGKLKKKGRYSVTCTFTPPSATSVLKTSSASGSFKVRKARRGR